MNAATKIGLLAAIVGIVVWVGMAAKKAIADFSFDVVAYGRPALSAGMVLQVPLQIKSTNPTPLPIDVDQLLADIYIERNGQYVLAAKVNQPISIPPGEHVQTVAPAVDLKSIFGGNVFNTLTAIQQIVQSRKMKLRTDVVAIYKGIALPKQSIFNDVEI